MVTNQKDPQNFSIKNIKLIVGLGNVGTAYIGTRHNVGFNFVETLAGTRRFREEKKFHAQIFTVKANSHKIILAKPTTLMNASGQAVQEICHFYKLKAKEVLVVHDDLDLQLGEYKIQFGRGPKIHNGVNSIKNRLGTKKFWRLRIGIDNRTPELRRKMNGATSYVLGKFDNKEVVEINEVIKSIINEWESKIDEKSDNENETPEPIDKMLKALKN